MTEQRRGSDGASEGGEVRCDVVDRGDKSPVHDVGDSDEEPHTKVTDSRKLTTVVVWPKRAVLQPLLAQTQTEPLPALDKPSPSL